MKGSSAGAAHWVVIGGLLVAHFLFRPALTGWRFGPDLVAGCVLLAALRGRAGAAAGLGFGAGVLEGALGLVGMGGTALVYTAVGYGASRWRELFFADVAVFLYLYLFVGCWVTQILIAAVPAPSLSWGLALIRAPATAGLTALLCGAAEQAAAGLPGE